MDTTLMCNGSFPYDGIFEKLLPPNTFALFETEAIVENDYVIGVQFNVKEPIALRLHSDPLTIGINQTAVLNLSFDEEPDIRVDLSEKLLPHFGLAKDEVYAVKCTQKGNWLKLYLADARKA